MVLDGSFIHKDLTLNFPKPLHLQIQDLLNEEECQLFVTACVLKELSALGDSVNTALLYAKNECRTINCSCPSGTNAAKCLETLIGDKNENKYFIATQDLELRLKLMELDTGGSFIYSIHFFPA